MIIEPTLEDSVVRWKVFFQHKGELWSVTDIYPIRYPLGEVMTAPAGGFLVFQEEPHAEEFMDDYKMSREMFCIKRVAVWNMRRLPIPLTGRVMQWNGDLLRTRKSLAQYSLESIKSCWFGSDVMHGSWPVGTEAWERLRVLEEGGVR